MKYDAKNVNHRIISCIHSHWPICLHWSTSQPIMLWFRIDQVGSKRFLIEDLCELPRRFRYDVCFIVCFCKRWVRKCNYESEHYVRTSDFISFLPRVYTVTFYCIVRLQKIESGIYQRISCNEKREKLGVELFMQSFLFFSMIHFWIIASPVVRGLLHHHLDGIIICLQKNIFMWERNELWNESVPKCELRRLHHSVMKIS